MQNLENKIINNRKEFDSEEPGDGHFERFAEKFRRAKTGKRIRISYYLRIAAVLLFVSMTSILVYELINTVNRNTYEYTFGKLSTEYREIEDFFIHNIHSGYNRLESLNIGDEDQKETIIEELKEMDDVLKGLSRELNNDPNNERLINAIIQHYQLKVEIMNSIIGQLEEIRQITLNNNKNENKEI